MSQERDSSPSADSQTNEALDIAPAEDVGSLTFSRFRYQAEVTARHCLLMLHDRSIKGVICEWHEDFIVLRQSGKTELISVKHRERSQGPWTLPSLTNRNGGVSQLFRKWKRLDCAVRCMLLTNGGLNQEMSEICDVIHQQDPAARRAAAGQIFLRFQRTIPDVDLDQTERFLDCLSIDAQLSGRQSIRAVNITELIGTTPEGATVSSAVANAVYDLLVSLVEEAMRSEAGSPGSTLRYIRDPNRLRLDVARQRVISIRSIVPAQVSSLIQEVLSGASSSQLLRSGKQSDSPSALERKLLRGGLGPTAINSAKERRAAWSTLEAKYRQDFSSGNDDIEDLRIRALALAANAETAAISRIDDTGLYGKRMHIEATRTAKVADLARPPRMSLDDHHLMGLIYQLTDECKVWWSERFDTESPDV